MFGKQVLLCNIIRFIVFILCSFLLQTTGATEFSSPVISFQSAWFIDIPVDTPPSPGDNRWKKFNLPDVWYDNHRNDQSPAWYRMDFIVDNIDDIKEPWGIYLPAVNTNAVVWLNDKRIGDGGRMQDPAARNWHRPLYFSVPQDMLQQGSNSIYIHFLPKRSSFGFLGIIHVGPDVILRPAFKKLSLFKQTTMGVSTVLLFSFGAFISLLWFKRRHDSMYGWFSAASFSWAFVAFDMYVQHVPVPERLWDTLVFATVGWLVIFMIIFSHRFWQVFYPRYERFLIGFGLTGTVILYLVGDQNFYFVSSFIWDNLLIIFSLYMAWFIISHCIKCSSNEAWPLVLSTIVAISFGSHDNLVQMGILAVDRTHLMPLGGVLMLGTIVWMLLRRFVTTLDNMENINQDLDTRVQIKTKELEKNYRQIQKNEHEKILSQERERIMRDMHDGIGGHLVAALAQIESDNINKSVLCETLQHALEDIRLMIDSLDPVDEDIISVLAMFRSRIEPRLNYSGIHINWKVQDIPTIEGFSPEKILQLMHILQEIVTNIIKHAKADVITFSTGVIEITRGQRKIFIEISDDGHGFSDEFKKGRGISNMFHRASTIDAILEIGNNDTGATIRILLPLSFLNDAN